LDGIYLRPASWYREHGIDLRLDAEVVSLDLHAKAVTANGREELFDALIIATGAAPALLAFARDFPNDVVPLWGVRESLAIRDRLASTRHLLVLGGGISGVESALFACEAGREVTLVEKMNHLIPQQLGLGAATALTRRLQKAGVSVITGRFAVSAAKPRDQLFVTFDDASERTCDLVLTTVGANTKLDLFARAGVRTDRGIVVDEYQQTSMPGVFACGDIAQRDGVRVSTVVRAHEQGRGAGDNAAAFVQGRKLAYVAEPIAPLFFKHKDVEVQSVGPPAGAGLEEKVLTDDGEAVYRSILLDNGELVGAQMIGSHEGFRQLVDSLGQPYDPMSSDEQVR